MADNYNFFDADASILTAGSSVIGSIHYPVVKIFDSVLTVSQGGTNISSLVSTVPSSVIVGASVFGNVGISGTANVAGSVLSITRPAPIPSVIQGTADLRVVQGASVVILSAPGASVNNYVQNVQIANFGPSSVLVTIADNTTSILGYSIAPAGSGSNYNCFYKAAANSPVTASINGVASVLVSAQGFTA